MLKAILWNRYTITFGAIAVAAAIWNIWVINHDDGLLIGKVVDSSGRAVENAQVVLSEKSLLVTAPRDKTTTNADGEFRFEGHYLHHLYLEAKKEGFGRAKPVQVRLYFKGQNKTLIKPLLVEDST